MSERGHIVVTYNSKTVEQNYKKEGKEKW